MKPDIRPVSILTRAILDTSPAWVLLTAGNGYIYPSAGLRLDGALLMAPDGLCFFDHQRCYPCKADAPFEPIPWVVVEGEEIIREWHGLDWDVVPVTHYWPALDEMSWRVWDTGFPGIKTHHRMHPAPRRQINADGTETPVWVWEADQ